MTSLLGGNKLEFMLQQLRQTEHVHGNIIEVGVYQGGALSEMYNVARTWRKTVQGYDTFEGLTEKSDIDVHSKGEFSCPFDEVRKNLDHHIELIQGVYPVTIKHKNLSFCHLDIDQYFPTKMALYYIMKHLSVEGIVVLDDYGWKNCPGIAKAAHELLEGQDDLIVNAANLNQISLKKVK